MIFHIAVLKCILHKWIQISRWSRMLCVIYLNCHSTKFCDIKSLLVMILLYLLIRSIVADWGRMLLRMSPVILLWLVNQMKSLILTVGKKTSRCSFMVWFSAHPAVSLDYAYHWNSTPFSLSVGHYVSWVCMQWGRLLNDLVLHCSVVSVMHMQFLVREGWLTGCCCILIDRILLDCLLAIIFFLQCFSMSKRVLRRVSIRIVVVKALWAPLSNAKKD